MTWFDRECSVLASAEINRVHQLTLEVLRRKGVLFHSARARDIFAHHGAGVSGECVRLPPHLVESCLSRCPSGFLWQARNEAASIYVGEGQARRVHVMQNHGPVYVQQRDGVRRHGTLEDVINFYKLGQVSPVNTIVGQVSVDPHELTGPTKQRRITRELLRHSDKPMLSYPGESYEANRQVFEMVEMVMGRGYLENHYFLTASVCALSPLQYAEESADCIIAYAEANQPVTVLTAPMLGVSTPVNPIGALIAQNVELLAGIVLAQLVRPGVPVVYGTATYTADMRTGGFITGDPQSNLVDRAALQLAQTLYNLPTRTLAGNTDAKVPDLLAGYETMQNYIQLLMGGTHMINECLGILDGMMTVSYEKYIADEEMLDRVQRMMGGLSTDENDFDISALLETPHMESFLMHPSTLEACAEQWRPTLAPWQNYEAWQDAGSPCILERAARICAARLAEAPTDLLGAELNNDLAAYAAKG